LAISSGDTPPLTGGNWLTTCCNSAQAVKLNIKNNAKNRFIVSVLDSKGSHYLGKYFYKYVTQASHIYKNTAFSAVSFLCISAQKKGCRINRFRELAHISKLVFNSAKKNSKIFSAKIFR
jgi:hypothetical protein